MIEFDAGSGPAPTPVPVPTRDVWVIPRPHLPSAHTLYSLAVTAALAVVMAGRFLPALPVPDKPPSPAPAPVNAAESAGRAYARALGPAWARGLRAAGSAVAAGVPVADAQKAGDAAFLAARQDAFARIVTPVWSAVLPEGTEPTPAQREAFAKALNDTATGAEK